MNKIAIAAYSPCHLAAGTNLNLPLITNNTGCSGTKHASKKRALWNMEYTPFALKVEMRYALEETQVSSSLNKKNRFMEISLEKINSTQIKFVLKQNLLTLNTTHKTQSKYD